MSKLYKKNELVFVLLWIIAYVVGLSTADNISKMIGIEKSVTVIVAAVMTIVLVCWMSKNDLFCYYGICKSQVNAKRLLYYIPLVLMASVNLWFGIAWNISVLETLLYIISMLLVGFLEELIFRGLLFKVMCKDNVKTAIVISSVAFGIGHIVNLVNGSGADLFSNLLQVIYAIAAGFLFTILFYKTKSLWACIITHSVLNALSVFANEKAVTTQLEIFSAVVLVAISVLYSVFILRTLKKT